MHFYFFLSMLSNQFCEHLAVVAGNRVEGVSLLGKGRSAGTGGS